MQSSPAAGPGRDFHRLRSFKSPKPLFPQELPQSRSQRPNTAKQCQDVPRTYSVVVKATSRLVQPANAAECLNQDMRSDGPWPFPGDCHVAAEPILQKSQTIRSGQMLHHLSAGGRVPGPCWALSGVRPPSEGAAWCLVLSPAVCGTPEPPEPKASKRPAPPPGPALGGDFTVSLYS